MTNIPTARESAGFYLGFIVWGEDEFGKCLKGCAHRPQCLGGLVACPFPGKF